MALQVYNTILYFATLNMVLGFLGINPWGS